MTGIVKNGQGGDRIDWREALRRYARQRWQDIFTSLTEGKPLSQGDDSSVLPLLDALGSRADEAIHIVDRFAMGAAAEKFASGQKDVSGPSNGFAEQLDTILEGLQPSATASGGADAPEQETGLPTGRKRVFQSELWQVLHKVRESAELSYAREIDLVELDRRILFLLKGQGPLVPAGLSAAIGVDKAQVSRSVKRLLELKMVQRDQIRSPVQLTRKGEVLAARLLRLAELRNRELSFDVSDAELSDFFGVMDVLLDRAVTLYEQERELATGHDSEPAIGFEPKRSNEAIVIDRSRIVSPLLTLSAYFSRSGALAFKRRTGLSNFEAWVLSEIARDPPTEWASLVKRLERDHSQAGRTVNHLVEKDLVTREGRPGRRHGRFSPSEEGKRLYEIIEQTAAKRSAFLLEPLSKEQLSSFLTTFDKIRRNAAAQLERERAFEELENS